MKDNKYKQNQDIEDVLSLYKSRGWEKFQADLVVRIEKLSGIKDSLLSQHKDREAGEYLARQKELIVSLHWAEKILKSSREEKK